LQQHQTERHTGSEKNTHTFYQSHQSSEVFKPAVKNLCHFRAQGT